MARYSLFLLKVPLNTNKPNQTYYTWHAAVEIAAGLLSYSKTSNGHEYN